MNDGGADELDETSAALGTRGDGINSNLEIPLVVVLWEHDNYGGTKRVFVGDESNLRPGNAEGRYDWNGYTVYWPCQTGADFDNMASAVGVHPGPDFAAYVQREGHEPTVTLWSDPGFGGSSITLRAGAYPSLAQLGMNDVVSSLRLPGDSFGVRSSPFTAATIAPIKSVVRVHTTWPSDRCSRPDHTMTIVESSTNLLAEYGGSFNDSISDVEVLRGPNAVPFVSRVTLFNDLTFTGLNFNLFSPGYRDLGTSIWNDRLSSIFIER
jgi:hypothetical protein